MATSSIGAPVTAETRTAFAVLAALSLCHLLNDTIQSLLPAIYPVLQQNYLAHLHPDRRAASGLPGHRLAVAAPGRALYRQAADVPALDLRHGREPDRPRHPRLRQPLLGAARRRRRDRRRLLDLPSRQLAGRPRRLGRPLRLRPVLLPGRRQHRLGDRAAARRLRGAAVRPVEHRLVLQPGAHRDGAALERRHLGPRPAPRQRRQPRRCGAGLAAAAAAGDGGDRRARGCWSSASTSTSRA